MQALRPGSRTVVCQPQDMQFIVEMARHGFRLMLVHQDIEFLRQTREQLRNQGLSSLLMGSFQSEAAQVPSLARGFYEAVLLCSASKIRPEEVLFALGPGGILIRETDENLNLSGLLPLKLPPGYIGGRIP
ncbi:MAG: hypothetical protein WC314_23025 [Vulcanimicrobiota bacterium]